MNRKIFAAFFSTLLLCSCGKGDTAEVSEAETESAAVTSAVASETAVTTTAAETASETVSEVSEGSEKAPITRDFFNDDVVFEEVLLPIKVTWYENGKEDQVYIFEYDAAGNEIERQGYTYEYDYNPNGTYNSVTTNNEFITRFDKNGYCIEKSSLRSTTSYEYKFDKAGRLVCKSTIYGEEKKNFEYTYDAEGRLYEESCFYTDYTEFDEITICEYKRRHIYDGNIENIYCFGDNFEEEMLWKIIEKDENGNVIKEIVNEGADLGKYRGKTFVEYKYDTLNRLIYKNQIVSDDYFYDFYDEKKRNYTLTCEYENDKIKKITNTDYDCIEEYFYDENDRVVEKTYTFSEDESTDKYFYNNDGTILIQNYSARGTLICEKECAMIPKIKTGIEYKEFYEVEP